MTTTEQIAEIASNVKGSGDGQGPFYNPLTKTVFWSGGDSDFDEECGHTSWEEVEAKLAALDGVEEIILEAEMTPEDLGLDGFSRIDFDFSAEVKAWERAEIVTLYGEDIAREVCGD